MRTKLLFGVCVWMVALSAGADCVLRGTQYLESKSDTSAMAVADFNQDGRLDVALVGKEAGLLRVYINQKDSTFSLSGERKLMNHPFVIQAADLNGDTIPDLVVGGASPVIILINNGSGMFTPGPRVATPAMAIAVADFNSDSATDLAVLTRLNGGTVSIYLNAAQKISKSQSFSIKDPTDMIAMSSSAGRPTDLVVTSSRGTATILKGSAAGTFQQQAEINAVPGASHAAAAMINGDAQSDLLVTGSDGLVAVLLGTNTGAFTRTQLSTGSDIQGLALADFNSDSRTDLFLVNRNARGSFYNGNGKGGFVFKGGIAYGVFKGPVVAADFNGDHSVDLIIAESGAAGVYPGTGHNGFVTGIRSVASQGGSLFAGDFNGDRMEDLIVSSSTGSILLPGNGNGSFRSPVATTLPQLGLGTVIDLNGDGEQDLVAFEGFMLKAWLSTDTFQFLETAKMPFNVDPPVQSLDMNGDGRMDIVVMTRSRLNIFPGKGDGTFSPVKGVSFHYEEEKGIVTDLNGDGVYDLVTATGSNKPELRIYIGAPDFSFVKLTEVSIDSCPGALASGDLNGDGHSDLVVGSTCRADLRLMFGDGTGTFSSTVVIPFAGGAMEPRLADFNSDGLADIYDAALLSGKPVVATAPNWRDFHLYGPYYWNHVAVADFNGDGKPDLAASSYNSTAVFLDCQ